jgi:hypothetical protein
VSGLADISRRARRWLPLVAVAGLAVLVALQAWAYGTRFTLSLGPRVILQPWLIQHRYVMYENIADLHTPFMPLFLTLLRPLITDGLQRAKTILIVLLSLTTLLTFLAGRRSAGWLGGLAAAAFLVVWSPGFEFGKLWHESFLAPLYALSLVIYDASAVRRSRAFPLLIGLAGGLAALIKQHAAVVFAAFVLWTVLAGWRQHLTLRRSLRDLALIGAGALAPVLGLLLWQYMRAGTLQGLVYWTLTYNLTSDYKSLAAQGPTTPEVGVVASSCLLIPAALLTLLRLKRRGDAAWLNLGWGLTLLAASGLTAYPRFALFHLQPALPAIAWLSAVTLQDALRPQAAPRHFAIGMTVALMILWLVTPGPAYPAALGMDRPQVILEYSDLVPLAHEIRQTIGPDDCVYIFPDDEATANLYYLMRCLPPSFWVFHYPWNLTAPIQDGVLQMLEQQPPQWIIHSPGRWEIELHAPDIMAFMSSHYQRTAQLHWAQGEVWLLKRLPPP